MSLSQERRCRREFCIRGLRPAGIPEGMRSRSRRQLCILFRFARVVAGGSPRHRARMPPCSGANVEKCPLPPRLQAASFPWPTPSARRCSSRRGRGGLRGVPPSLFVAAAGHRLRVHADTWAAMRPCGLCDWRGRPLSGYSAPERPLLAHRKGLYVSAGRPNKKGGPSRGRLAHILSDPACGWAVLFGHLPCRLLHLLVARGRPVRGIMPPANRAARNWRSVLH